MQHAGEFHLTTDNMDKQSGAWFVVVVLALAAQAGCRCNSDVARPGPPAPPEPARASQSHSRPTEVASPVAAPGAPTATTAPAETGLPPPQALAEAPPWFEAARGDLRRRLGRSVATGTAAWRRTRGSAVWDDTLRFRRQEVAVLLPDLDAMIVRDATGCTVRTDAAPLASAACEPEAAVAADVLAAISALTNTDLAAAWTLEALQTGEGGSVRVRAALRSWRLRVLLDLDPKGQVRSLTTAAGSARLRGTGTDWQLDVLQGVAVVWTWQPAPVLPAAANGPGNLLQVATVSGEALSGLIERAEGAFSAARLAPVGPLLLTVQVSAMAQTWQGLRVAALRSPMARDLPAGASWVPATPPGPLVRVLEGKPDTLPQQLSGLGPGCYVLQVLGPAKLPSANGPLIVVVRTCP